MSLDDLVSHPQIWRARDAQPCYETLATGCAELDRYLPGGGWPRNAITEIFLERYGVGELSLLMPALAFLSKEERWIVWIDPPFIPYAPALTRCGINIDRVLLVHASAVKQHALWAIEQALRSRSSIAILAWLKTADDKALRRLQLAAEAQSCWTVLFRPVAALTQRSPAALRIKMSKDSVRTRLDIIKCRGQRPEVVFFSADRPQ